MWHAWELKNIDFLQSAAGANQKSSASTSDEIRSSCCHHHPSTYNTHGVYTE